LTQEEGPTQATSIDNCNENCTRLSAVSVNWRTMTKEAIYELVGDKKASGEWENRSCGLSAIGGGGERSTRSSVKPDEDWDLLGFTVDRVESRPNHFRTRPRSSISLSDDRHPAFARRLLQRSTHIGYQYTSLCGEEAALSRGTPVNACRWQ
jgi:hypothetical protein